MYERKKEEKKKCRTDNDVRGEEGKCECIVRTRISLEPLLASVSSLSLWSVGGRTRTNTFSADLGVDGFDVDLNDGDNEEAEGIEEDGADAEDKEAALYVVS